MLQDIHNNGSVVEVLKSLLPQNFFLHPSKLCYNETWYRIPVQICGYLLINYFGFFPLKQQQKNTPQSFWIPPSSAYFVVLLFRLGVRRIFFYPGRVETQ